MKLTDAIAEAESKLSELENASEVKLTKYEELQAEKEEEVRHYSTLLI
jgi:hypothetical protein